MRSQLSVTLKERLSTLSNSSSGSSMPISPTTAKAKLRKVIPTSWKRHTGNSSDNPEQCGPERLQEVISRLIFQAGVDFETRPMVVIAASALPDPEEVSYDLLLTRILSYLDLYVESDYIIVFMAAGGHHAPSWNWLWKAYRSQLSRKYRKNLKKLYIVHPSFFSKMLFSLAGAIISPKFYQKLQYCSTLSELARHVPLTQIDIPPAVYEENVKHESGITLPIKSLGSSHFGVPLEELMGIHGEKGAVPGVVRDCAIFIRQHGMEQEGLFRRSPLRSTLDQAKKAYDRGHPIKLESYEDANLAAVLAAVLLKMFFHDLPTPIFPQESYDIIRRCPPPSAEDGDMACIAYIRESILPALNSYCAVIALSYALNLLHDISLRAHINKMDAHNLAVVFTPNLLKSTNPLRDAQMCKIPGKPATISATTERDSSNHTTVGMVIKCCIEHYYEIFDENPDRSEALPLRPAFSVRADEDPDDKMLVMPVVGSSPSSRAAAPPSAWASELDMALRAAAGTNMQQSAQSPSSVNGLAARSVATGGTLSGPLPVLRKSQSTITIENKGPATPGKRGGKRGSIRVNSGTFGKSAGSAVEAWGVTASGFFSPAGGSAQSSKPTNARPRGAI